MTAITKHWPKIATSLVALLGIVELVAGGLTADSGVELYLMAWAAATGGLWFLFEKAERTLSMESREIVARRLIATDYRDQLESMPQAFAVLFDRVFGNKHLSWTCFARSSVCSLLSIVLITWVWLSITFPRTALVNRAYAYTVNVDVVGFLGEAGAVLALAAALNLIPDFLSLWQTRKVMGWAGRVSPVTLLGIDFLFTVIISSTVMFGVGRSAFYYDPAYLEVGVDVEAGRDVERPSRAATALAHFGELVTFAPGVGNTTLPLVPTRLTDFEGYRGQDASRPPVIGFPQRWRPQGLPPAIFFYSAFFTSILLWLYAASTLVSRVLLKMNSGVGFLLRVSDVERQPLRSMGFVSVVIMSLLFALGLPLVLL
ncbi:MAG TPA: hypothetical protein VNB06_04700 [Thermoanaerobaculia bacterium]|nr:hypothetical protein [Thermoanaerobaculia bacterium]